MGAEVGTFVGLIVGERVGTFVGLLVGSWKSSYKDTKKIIRTRLIKSKQQTF